MAHYLYPNDSLSLEDQREIFSIRCEVNFLPGNKGEKINCETKCGEILNNQHIRTCKILNGNEKYEYDKIINGTLNVRQQENHHLQQIGHLVYALKIPIQGKTYFGYYL